MTQEDVDRYMRAMHAIQSGVAMEMNWNTQPTSPKHLRVGINAMLVDTGAMAQLLIAKGVITEDEYEKALADMAELEVKRYEELIREHYGTNGPNITLG